MGVSTANPASVEFVKGGTTVTGAVTYGAEGPQAAIPYSIVSSDGEVLANWTFTVDGAVYKRTQQYRVVTPLFTQAELVDFDVDFTPLTTAKYKNLERLVRQVIEAYTGQNFGLEYGSFTLYGSGNEVINSPKRILTVDTLLPYGLTAEQASGFFLDTRVIDDGYAIIKASPYDYSIKADVSIPYGYESSGGVIRAPYSLNQVFSPNARYTLTGTFGWYTVPDAVKDAALLLAQTFSCDDVIWRDRFVDSMKTATSRMDFNSRQYTSTGNHRSDQLLDGYVVNGMAVL